MIQVVHTAKALQKLLEPIRFRRESIGFVPTMGALHEGHVALLRESVKENSCTVLSIFVNPTQFGPKEDLTKYPRTLDQDIALAEKCGVDIVFAPSGEEIYPPGFSTFIEPGDVAKPLCGAFRPGHYRGVCTVVARLFGMVRPHRAYFGQKDIQQCLVLLQMVKDLVLDVELKICETVREKDGLAMSSRNRYLSAYDREIAKEIYQALVLVEKAFQEGERNVDMLKKIAFAHLSSFSKIEIQYLEILSYPYLSLLNRLDGPAVLAVAVHIGGTRLIDNIILTFKV